MRTPTNTLIDLKLLNQWSYCWKSETSKRGGVSSHIYCTKVAFILIDLFLSICGLNVRFDSNTKIFLNRNSERNHQFFLNFCNRFFTKIAFLKSAEFGIDLEFDFRPVVNTYILYHWMLKFGDRDLLNLIIGVFNAKYCILGKNGK